MNKYGMNLVELAQELVRRHGQKRDYIIPTHRLSLKENGKLEIGSDQFPLTDHAHTQIANWAEIPRKYYERMRVEAPDLLKENVNHWFFLFEGNRMIRTLDGAARAFLSDRYHRIDNEQIADAALPALLEECGHGSIVSCNVTDSKLYIQALFPRLEGEVKPGDPVQGGLIITNGEIGDSALDIRPMIYRLVCTNGLITGNVANDARLRRNHLGRRLMAGEDYSLYTHETLAADDRALKLKIRDSIHALARPDLFNRILADMQDATRQPPISHPVAAVVELKKSYDLAQGEQDSILINLIRDADYSKWGMVNAITEAANDHPSYDRAIELQSLGGRVLELKPTEWRHIAHAKPSEAELAL